MTRDEFNQFCASLPATTHVVQWGGSDVWKVGGKLFALCSGKAGAVAGITFKTSDMAYELLQERPGLRPAPYLASRGMKWIQRHDAPGLPMDDLKAYLTEAHRLVTLKLPRKKRQELGLG